MKRVVVMVVSLVALCVGVASRAQQTSSMPQHASGHVVMTPDAIKWGPAPPSLPPGAQAAMLNGDPAKAEPFTLRLRLPDGFIVPPHWHPTDENVTVLQGTLMMGTGEKVDASAMKSLTAGSFSVMPKEVRHYVKAKGETLIQVSAVGPFAVTYVNPQDDPRKKAGSN
jgi:quercetin dioxygenase-like cupin family protein